MCVLMYFQITKKLAGNSAGTASWATDVGNEYGQVLMCVLTAREGSGLDMMAAGLVQRYEVAGEDPPLILYVDRDCCSPKTRDMFSAWSTLAVRLDIWHFMRRFATACTTDAHQLYGTFMSKLSGCIFEWDKQDWKDLRIAVKADLAAKRQLKVIADKDIDRHITKKQMALHCRRRTRGAEMTKKLIGALLTELTGDSGKDTLGVPLLDEEKMWAVWEVQQRHIECIQDPPDIQLYTVVGTMKKGGLVLNKYRCARGSTSLESFHLHLNRFIPGKHCRYAAIDITYPVT